jgi:hypothetical protein
MYICGCGLSRSTKHHLIVWSASTSTDEPIYWRDGSENESGKSARPIKPSRRFSFCFQRKRVGDECYIDLLRPPALPAMRYVLSEIAVFDEAVAPYGLQQFVFEGKAARISNREEQQVEGFRGERAVTSARKITRFAGSKTNFPNWYRSLMENLARTECASEFYIQFENILNRLAASAALFRLGPDLRVRRNSRLHRKCLDRIAVSSPWASVFRLRS